MPHPIVIAHHLIWTIYGYWLPNDPRGSGSNFIRDDVLKVLGDLHYGRKRIQPVASELREFDRRARGLLAFPVVQFDKAAIRTVAQAFAQVIRSNNYTCYACAIMPDHVHILIRKHKHTCEEMTRNFQRESHLMLCEHGLFDLEHPIWGGHGYSVYLDHPDDVWLTIPYIEENPSQARIRAQQYDFVTPYNNWPLHEGHSPNSPYAKRLRRR